MAKAADTQRIGAAASASALAGRIYSTHRAQLLAIARRNGASTQAAEDALQDAFAIFIDRFDPACDTPPLAWLATTLKRRCWAIYRRERQIGQSNVELCAAIETGTRHGILADASARPDELVEDAERVTQMRSRLTGLKPQERRALGLLALGYSYREICGLNGWSYTKVNRCIAEGRARLRQLAS